MSNIALQVSDADNHSEKSKDELMNEVVLNLLESCQKLLYAIDIIVKVNPYSDNADGNYDNDIIEQRLMSLLRNMAILALLSIKL